MGSNQITPRGAGGLAVFDDAVPRSAKLTTDVYKVAWGKDSTHLFAQSDPNISSQSLVHTLQPIAMELSSKRFQVSLPIWGWAHTTIRRRIASMATEVG